MLPTPSVGVGPGCQEVDLRPSQLILPSCGKRTAMLCNLLSLFGISRPDVTRFPGALPVNLERKHFATLLNDADPYLVFPKSDGERFLLFLGTHAAGGKQFAYMIDRTMAVYEVAAQAEARYYHGSVFDGELTTEKHTEANIPIQVFHVFDCVAMCGRSLRSSPLSERMDLLKSSFYDKPHNVHELQTEYAVGNNPHRAKIILLRSAFQLSVVRKIAHPLSSLPTILKNPGVFHAVDGIVFQRLAAPLQVGRDDDAFKWKMEHTLDFAVRRPTPDVPLQIWYRDQKGKLSDAPLVCASRAGPVKFVVCSEQAAFDCDDMRNDPQTCPIYECVVRLDNEGTLGVCMLTKPRPTKQAPNAAVTIEKTLVSIEENIQDSELFVNLCVCVSE